MKRAIMVLVGVQCLTACTKKEQPQPSAPTAEVTFADANGVPDNIVSFSASLANINLYPAPQVLLVTKAVLMRVNLTNGRFLEVLYPFDGNAFPAAGPVTLRPFIGVTYSDNAAGVGYTNNAAISLGALQVESVTPQLVSGTYTGPVQNRGPIPNGGPTMKLTFKHVKVD